MIFSYILRSSFNKIKNSIFLFLLLSILGSICILLIIFINGSKESNENFYKNEGNIAIYFYNINDKESFENFFNIISKEYFCQSSILCNGKIIIQGVLKDFIIKSLKENDIEYSNFIVKEGKFPQLQEVMLPDYYKKNNEITIGSILKIRITMYDGIINTRNLKVSGFFSTTSINKNFAIINSNFNEDLYGLKYNIIKFYFDNNISKNVILLNEQMANISSILKNYIYEVSNKFNYSINSYINELIYSNSIFKIASYLLFIIILINVVLQFFLFLNFSIYSLETDFFEYSVLYTFGIKEKQILLINTFKNLICLLFISLFSYVLSLSLAIVTKNAFINLQDSYFLSPLLGNFNKISYSFNFSKIILFNIVLVVLIDLLVHFILKNKLKDAIIINVQKYSKDN